MATFQKVTQMATVPIGAAALTSATSLLLGRQTSSKSTNHVSNAASRKFHSAIRDRCYQHQHQHQRQLQLQSSSSSNLNSTMAMAMRNAAQRQARGVGNANGNIQQRKFSTNTNTTQRNLSTAPTEAAVVPPAATATSTSNAKPASQSFIQWYEGHLAARPVLTKMMTGSTLWGLGDACAQTVPAVFFNDDAENANAIGNRSAASYVSALKQLEYDHTRTARAMIYGFCFHAPASHVHFNFLEKLTVKGGFTGLSIPVFKAFMEQIVYWSWISNSMYHGCMGTMQGKSPQQVYDRISDVLWETQKAQWAFWIPVQLLNFRFVPVRHQLNVVLMTSVVWTALLSAWYPPEKNGVDVDVDAVIEDGLVGEEEAKR